MKHSTIESVQEWLPLLQILEHGILHVKPNRYLKIIKILPINYHLKSDLEKEAILHSYQTFLQTCHFDMQFIIKSNKEDLSHHIQTIQTSIKQEQNPNRIRLAKQYIEFIQKKNQEQQSSSKQFFIIIQKTLDSSKTSQTQIPEWFLQELNENYLKIKECLSRCGNLAMPIEDQKEVRNILKSFFYHFDTLPGKEEE